MTGRNDSGFDPVEAWLGAFFTGVISLLVWAVRSDVARSRAGTVGLAVVLASILLALAFFARRRGRTDRAVGIVGGYGALTLISGGACTITFDDARLELMVAGLFGYGLLLVVSLIVALAFSAVRRRRER
jgi:hypothetical protein